MSPTKLSSYNKDEIIERYRQPQGSTSTLASHYGVSSSTISRFLKKHLSSEEYQHLVEEKKRINRYADRLVEALESESTAEKPKEKKSVAKVKAPQSKKIKQAVTPKSKPKTTAQVIVKEEPLLTDDLVAEDQDQALDQIKEEQPKLEVVAIEPSEVTAVPRLKLKGEQFAEPKPTLSLEEEEVMDTQANALTIREMIGEDVDDDDDYDDDEDDDLDDGEDEEEDEDSAVEIMPLAEAVWPRVAYLIVDRNGELMTRTLQEFRYLGPVPATEANEVALPIFDNHRVAKRYTNKREKVIKIPDCGLFQKTTPNLRSKGISRILMKSNIYTLT